MTKASRNNAVAAKIKVMDARTRQFVKIIATIGVAAGGGAAGSVSTAAATGNLTPKKKGKGSNTSKSSATSGTSIF